jgi:hypothetical protein
MTASGALLLIAQDHPDGYRLRRLDRRRHHGDLTPRHCLVKESANLTRFFFVGLIVAEIVGLKPTSAY